MNTKNYALRKLAAFVILIACSCNAKAVGEKVVQIGQPLSVTAPLEYVATPFGTTNLQDKTQMLYLGQELEMAGLIVGSRIRSIGFLVDMPAQTIPTVPNAEVFVKNTDATSMNGFQTGLGKVFEGNISIYTVPGGWVEIQFDEPFIWDGRNMLIEVAFNGAGYLDNSTVYYDAPFPGTFMTTGTDPNLAGGVSTESRPIIRMAATFSNGFNMGEWEYVTETGYNPAEEAQASDEFNASTINSKVWGDFYWGNNWKTLQGAYRYGGGGNPGSPDPINPHEDIATGSLKNGEEINVLRINTIKSQTTIVKDVDHWVDTDCDDKGDTHYTEWEWDYESGDLRTKYKWHHGYYEIRAKLPKTDAIVGPNWWFWGTSTYYDDNGVLQKATTEIDVFEQSAAMPDYTSMAVHFGTCDADADPNCKPDGYQYNNRIGTGRRKGVDFSDDFHVYGIHWEEEFIRFYIDDELVGEVTEIVKNGEVDPRDLSDLQPVPMILDANLGTHVNKQFYTNGIMPQLGENYYFEVDYVRAYQKKPTTTGIPNPAFEVHDAIVGTVNVGFGVEGIDPNATHSWAIYSSDGMSRTSPVALQTGTGSSITFNQGIDNATHYLVEHTATIGTQQRVEEQVVFVNLADFSIEMPNCPNEGEDKMQIVVTANSTTQNSRWDIWECDVNGNVTSGILGTGYGGSYTFTNLDAERFYKVQHGIWGTVEGPWQEEDKFSMISSYHLFDADFDVDWSSSILLGDLLNLKEAKACDGSFRKDNRFYHKHIWIVYESDASKNEIQEIDRETTFDDPEVTFHGSGIDESDYYIIKHGVFNGCCDWMEVKRWIGPNGENEILMTEESFINEVLPSDTSRIYKDSMIAEFYKTVEAQESEMVSTFEVQDEFLDGLNYYPNPANDQLNVEAPSAIDRISVFAVSGQEVLTQFGNSESTVVLDISELPAGSYLIKVTSGQSSMLGHFVVE